MNDDPEVSAEKSLVKDAAAGGSYGVLRNRDLRLYLTARLFAATGQQMMAMAIGWELFERTHDALMLGLVGLTQIVPMLAFTLPAGHIADNYNRKKIILLMTVFVMATSLGLAVVSALHAPVFWIYCCLFALGTARTFMWAASAAFLPSLVERRQLSRAVNFNASVFQISSIAGPVMGGALIRFVRHGGGDAPAAPVYALNAVAALVCCILVSLIRQHHVVAIKEKMTLRALLTGFNFVFSNRIILGIITLDMFAVLLGGAVALLPVYAKEILQVGPVGLGFLEAALPMGAVLCTFVLAHRPPLQKAGRALLWSVVVFGLATIVFGYSKWFWLSLLMLVVCGFADNISVVVRHTLVQLLTPDEKRGRVSSVNNLFVGTSNELGGFESGLVAHLFGKARGLPIATGAVVAVVSGGVGTILVVIAVALIWPEIRKYGRLDAH